MTVKWSNNSQLHWFETANYIKREFGLTALDAFAKSTDDVLRQVSAMPSCGSIEPILSHRTNCYRGIVFGKHSKLIYLVQNDSIFVVDYWDTRQEPKQLADRI